MTLGMKTVLLIDDNDLFCTILADWLGFQGFQTLIANNGQSGIQLAQKFQPDIILCEANTPQVNGFDILKQVRDNANIAQIPFIFLTSESSLRLSRLLPLGANGLIMKSGGLEGLRRILTPLAIAH